MSYFGYLYTVSKILQAGFAENAKNFSDAIALMFVMTIGAMNAPRVSAMVSTWCAMCALFEFCTYVMFNLHVGSRGDVLAFNNVRHSIGSALATYHLAEPGSDDEKKVQKNMISMVMLPLNYGGPDNLGSLFDDGCGVARVIAMRNHTDHHRLKTYVLRTAGCRMVARTLIGSLL